MSANNTTATINPFQPSTTSYILGGLIMVSAIPGWLGNLVVIIAIVARGFLQKSAPVIYKLIGSLAFSDFLQLSIHLVYLGPSSCLQRWLLPEKWRPLPGNVILSGKSDGLHKIFIFYSVKV